MKDSYAHAPSLPPSRVLSRDGDPHVDFLEQGQVLKVRSVRQRDQGLYQCLASNNAGTQQRQFRLSVQGKHLVAFLFSNTVMQPYLYLYDVFLNLFPLPPSLPPSSPPLHPG